MQIAQEVNNYLTNIAAYVEKIEQAVEKQLEIDFQTNEMLSHPDSKRFIALNIMKANCGWIESNLKGTHTAMLSAIEQEKVKL